MTICLKYIKIIVLLLGMALQMSSCTFYKSKSLTVEDAAAYTNRRIKIKTIHGNEVKLRWIEETNENIVSIKDTKRVLVEKSSIQHVRVDQAIMPLDSALNHNGKIQINTDQGIYTFLRIQVKDDHILGIERTGNEILPVVIPKDQISKIKLKNIGLSIAATIGLGLLGFYVIALIV